jgi:hypothetical protein
MTNTTALDDLIRHMMIAPVYSPKQLEALWEKDRARIKAAIQRMLETGETYGVASGGPAFLNQPEEQFRQYLKNTDNDLDAQVKIVADAFSHYVVTGEAPAPYYPMRIAIILSKAKMKDKEREFLAAWCRHFSGLGRRVGARYGELIKRAEKLGVATGA